MNEDEQALADLLAEIEAEGKQAASSEEEPTTIREELDAGAETPQAAAETSNSEGKGRQTGETEEPGETDEEMADDPTVTVPDEEVPETDEEACAKKKGKAHAKMAAGDATQAASAGEDLVEQVLAPDFLGRLERVELEAQSNDSNLPVALRGKQLVQGKPVATFKLGIMKARDGRVFVVDDTAVRALLADGNSGQIVPFTYTHEKGPEGDQNSGYIWKHAVMDGYLKAAGVAWTQDAAADLATGKRGPVSPDVYTQALDPVTFEVLDRSSPLYAGPGKGSFGSPFFTNTFRPVRWRAVSLVGVPALPDLPIAQLSAQQTSAPKAEDKEHIVTHAELCSALGLDAEKTSPEQALAILKDRNQKASAAETASQQAAAALSADAQSALVAQQASAAAAKVEEDRKAAAKLAADEIRQEMAATARRERIDAELLAAEKDGRVVAAKRPYWLKKFELDEVEARQELSSLRPSGPGESHWYNAGANVESGALGTDPSISVDRLPERERNALLSRAVSWALYKGLEAKDFTQALSAVRSNDSNEAAYHRQVLASNPNWGLPLDQQTRRTGEPWDATRLSGTDDGAFRRTPRMALHPQFDPGRVEQFLTRVKAGAISANAIPEEVQQMMLNRQTMAGEAANFQPAARFAVPGMGYGVVQGTFGGSEMAPEFLAGATEQAYYIIYGNEALRVFVNASGVPEPIGRNAQDKPSMTRGTDFKVVTLHGYGNICWVDRRDQNASGLVLPIGAFAKAAQDSLDYGRNEKELIQSSVMRDTAKYASGYSRDMSLTPLRQWNDPSSTPIQDVAGIDQLIWGGTGKYPELTLMAPDVVQTLRFHPQILLAAREAAISHIDQPRAIAPIETLFAIFGPIVIPTCRITTATDGSGAASPWGKDVIRAVVSRGQIIAPRAFVTLVSSGYPLIRTIADEQRGLIGSDGADYADVFAVDVAGPASPGTTTSAYLLKNAVAALTIVP